ncbi:MAG: VOC family protein [Cyclobacteriaceae bacterium]|jgi:predicted enzyme related to lactoylglutathione lyase|nr:VOC family protein [Cyclobacteriaceae bacterium]
MKTSFLGLRTCIYKVTDLKSATEWYTQAFETEPYFNEPFYVGFNIAGYELGLIPDENPTQAKGDSVHTYWGVENVEKEYKRFIALGAIDFEEPHNVGGELVVGTVKDPWGNVVGMIYNPDFMLP